jgi:polyisoprenoid-binding protein YceI
MRLTPLTVLLFTCAAGSGQAGASTPGAPIRPESRIWITGGSNIRRFTCKASRISGTLELRGHTTQSPVLSGENASAAPSVSVTVNQLDCGIGVMSRHLHDVLGAARHANIDFRLASYEVDLRTAPPVARIAGVVTIAGVQRPVTTTATVREDSLGFLHVQGTYLIRPTEFGIAPPRRFGGLLRVRDRAAVHFDIALEPVGGWASDDRR